MPSKKSPRRVSGARAFAEVTKATHAGLSAHDALVSVALDLGTDFSTLREKYYAERYRLLARQINRGEAEVSEAVREMAHTTGLSESSITTNYYRYARSDPRAPVNRLAPDAPRRGRPRKGAARAGAKTTRPARASAARETAAKARKTGATPRRDAGRAGAQPTSDVAALEARVRDLEGQLSQIRTQLAQVAKLLGA